MDPLVGLGAEALGGLDILHGLSYAQLAELAAAGTEVAIEPGVVLFVEGQPADFWWLLIEGAIDLTRRLGREETLVARMDSPGRWAGGFRAWDGQGNYLATGRGAVEGRVLRLPAAALRDFFAAWSPLGAHLISGLYHTARSIESTARQRDSLVTLGTLAAGLAHEINNPAAAAARAAEGLDQATQGLLATLNRLAGHGITAEQFAGLDALRRELPGRPASSDPLDRADAEQALQDWLARRGVRRAWQLGAALAGAGADPTWCASVASVLPGPELEPGLEWVSATVVVQALVGEVRESTRRISELITAVRSYTQLDRASRQQVSVTEGLDSTLVMLGHKVRAGSVEVVRDYAADLPAIDANPGELNQVWTNLIDNALDAMAGEGTLTVTTRAHEAAGWIQVEIGDTGSGMPAEVAARAFEPFFTTKDVGHGTGLGLDIARRIVVERHGGSISVDSVPGATVFQIRLPVHAAGS